jgi:hypothetical protein
MISVFLLEYRTPLFEVRQITCQVLIFHASICLSFLRFLGYIYIYMQVIILLIFILFFTIRGALAS